MADEISPTTMTTENIKSANFGARLKSARESLGLECKDVATQLRLNEKVIMMMETERYPADLPITFIRGYLRAYGKLLQIPEIEIKKGIEPIQPKPAPQVIVPVANQPIIPEGLGKYIMQGFTYLIVFTMIGLVGVWWYTHQTAPAPVQIPIAAQQNQLMITPGNPPVAEPEATPTESQATPQAANPEPKTLANVNNQPAAAPLTTATPENN